MTLTAPRFWWEGGPAGWLLSPIGTLVGAIAARRMARAPDGRLSIPVICVGNPTVGGAGKTPTAIALAAMLKGEGLNPAFLLRGYGGRLSGPTAVDPALHRAADVGDEALLLATHGPTVISGDRLVGGRLAEAAGADIIVMDDGFQNPGLFKDVSVLVVDAAVGIGNGRVTPAGPMRAPLAPQLQKADAVILVGEGAPGERVAEAAKVASLPVLFARLVPTGAGVLRGRRVLVFAGIGRPAKVADTAREAGAEVVRLLAFPDHHPYTEADARGLLDQADREGLMLVTTEKDRARLAGGTGASAALAERAVALAVTLAFEDPAAVRRVLAGVLEI
ncbi:tetraacyldisaccharide 4'-kinase [Amorphus sp. 3PC139-8]|uniref:tetraacyldisaccharide 4'-kinase n=1 Tax=Amorphus sp. 3PC139-8 TaxID=2735676 RepID=UPI00345CBFDB